MDLIAKAVTLKSIRLHDSEANELLFSAKHAVLYQFNGNSWVKTNTEGCLAVYLRRNGSPQLIMLNRLQPENFALSLAEIGDVELEGELLMFKAGSDVMGIWLFDAGERQVLHSLIISQKKSLQQQSQPPALKQISLTDLLSAAVSKSQPLSVDDRLRQEFAGHSFDNVKEFSRAVARFLTLDPSCLAGLFEELKKQ